VTGIVLDTNVLSETTKPRPDLVVRAWFARQDPDRLYLTTTVLCELAEGIERLPIGRKRRELETWLDELVGDEFRGRILGLDVPAARIYGKLVASSYAQGRPPKVGDAQIAAVAFRDGLAVATRDVGDFAAFGVRLIDPWSEG
jgi:predicted nucleic acid-binding protein